MKKVMKWITVVCWLSSLAALLVGFQATYERNMLLSDNGFVAFAVRTRIDDAIIRTDLTIAYAYIAAFIALLFIGVAFAISQLKTGNSLESTSREGKAQHGRTA